jgi:hypothetical protein
MGINVGLLNEKGAKPNMEASKGWRLVETNSFYLRKKLIIIINKYMKV